MIFHSYVMLCYVSLPEGTCSGDVKQKVPRNGQQCQPFFGTNKFLGKLNIPFFCRCSWMLFFAFAMSEDPENPPCSLMLFPANSTSIEFGDQTIPRLLIYLHLKQACSPLLRS